MKCLNCGGVSLAIDSRPVADGAVVRRRRKCATCANRITTYEISAERYAVIAEAIDAAEAIGEQLDGLRRLAAGLKLLPQFPAGKEPKPRAREGGDLDALLSRLRDPAGAKYLVPQQED